ncbi:hypothetical protein MtrunA17_Chr8g0356551 [Medicago truncatula]|uniref:Transmembrane protein n=1 Tax=Medicago truncatula TaxID=3880 RepID=A0A396GHC8_MEDTR|nr:hypothetical protein MtrunA17_Chr8g0356551 [Medicago truncatula]
MFKLIYFLCLLLIIKCYIICKIIFVVTYLYIVGILNPKLCVLNISLYIYRQKILIYFKKQSIM